MSINGPPGIRQTDTCRACPTKNFRRTKVGLTLDQVRHYQPPPNLAKETDARFNAYLGRFGTKQYWELDALAPQVSPV
jgi:hypothetical protein